MDANTKDKGRNVFFSMIQPHQGSQTNSLDMKPQNKEDQKYTARVKQDLVEDRIDLKKKLRSIMSMDNLAAAETPCNMTVTDTTEERGECIFFGDWCRYKETKLKYTPVNISQSSKTIM